MAVYVQACHIFFIYTSETKSSKHQTHPYLILYCGDTQGIVTFIHSLPKSVQIRSTLNTNSPYSTLVLMSFINDADDFEDEIFFADEPESYHQGISSVESSNLSDLGGKMRGLSILSSYTVQTAQTTEVSSYTSAPIAIDASMIAHSDQDLEDELDFHMELKSLEMLTLIRGPEWAARIRDKKGHLPSFDRSNKVPEETIESIVYKESTSADIAIDLTDTEDYFLGSAYDFDMSEESGSQINVRGTPRGFIVEQQYLTDYRESLNRVETGADEQADHEEEGDVFVMDM